ncbi:hypothetical protein [Nocardiopsis sp. HUAS JQ3]|uniref:hypothetical protein n=1 Tax=Nocardiopsis sp. HUAS JQ3 TaxID=3061629 RepID=UPI0023A9BBE6|nr:hypothetical protein [Nocardiopsis sp. HUAS JQ3]WDZ91147.1 hypothetical protein PV789_00795 [Nocardiopsis sp. HUAS JQ3]
MRYATVEELVGFLPPGEPVPDDAEGLLDQATEDIDGALLTAVYDVDADGMPTAPAVVAALARATCAQAVWLDESGDRSGAGRQWATASLGGASYGRASDGSPGTGDLGPRAARILANAGLLSARVSTPGR